MGRPGTGHYTGTGAASATAVAVSCGSDSAGAAAIEAVAFLPVFYAHLALNDVPTLAPLTLSLLGTAGVLRKGRARDYLLAGIGLGLACATKYTAGLVLVPLVAAGILRYLDGGERAGRHALIGFALAASAALASFLIANPYAALDYTAFHSELVHQSSLSAEAQGKLGAPKQGGVIYYLWSLTWGLGWVPALAALGGALTVWRLQPRLGWLLVPPVASYLAVHGPSGALLRPLGAARVPHSVPARGLLRAALRGGAGTPGSPPARRIRPLARGGARAACAPVSSPRSRSRCAPRGSCTASTQTVCSRAPTPAL